MSLFDFTIAPQAAYLIPLFRAGADPLPSVTLKLMSKVGGLAPLLFFVPVLAWPQEASVVARLLAEPAVQAALEAAKRNEPKTIEDQIRLTEIEAPPFGEAARAQELKRDFESLGLKNVRIDKEGNVLAERPGKAPRPHLVFSAHLDTVFPKGTPVTVRREDTRLMAPGISDDGRGLAVVLAVARALQEAKVETPGTITFAGTVGEEGLGDLRGVKYLFQQGLKGQIDRFVSVDGAGLTITNGGVGSSRYKVTFRGPGGHSYGAFGNASPVHALGRAIARTADLKPPAHPKTTFNVGRIGGGTSVNSIAFEAWMEVDMRSEEMNALKALEAKFRTAMQEALAAENARAKDHGRIDVSIELVGVRPAGETPASSGIVRTALAVSEALGVPAPLRAGSTDANVAMNLKIPAITIDGGGSGKRAHSLDETFDTRDSAQGTQRATLLAIALAQ